MAMLPYLINAYFVFHLNRYRKTPDVWRLYCSKKDVQFGDNEPDRPLVNNGALLNESVDLTTDKDSQETAEGTLITPQDHDQV